MEQRANPSRTASVYIINQDQKTRNSLSTLVRSMGLAHEYFDSAEDFLSSFVPSHPGCVVTEHRMLGMSSIELLGELSKKKSALAVVILTAHGLIPVAVKAMQSGASAFLENPCSENELWLAIKDAVDKNNSRLQKKHEWELILDKLKSLTVKERSVLEFVAEGSTNKQIAAELDLGLRTVEARRNQIKQKLGVKSTVELVRFYTRACSFDRLATLE